MNKRERLHQAQGFYRQYYEFAIWTTSYAKTVMYRRKARRFGREVKHLRKEIYGHNSQNAT